MAGEPRKKSIIAVTVAAVGLLTLAAVIPVLAPDGVFAHTAGPAYNTNSEENSSGSAPNAGTREEYRETMLDMLRDHMGLEGSEAEEWADTMLQRMDEYSGANGDAPAGYFPGCDGDGSGMMGGGGDYGSSMMGGGGGYGSGMMGGGGYSW